MKVKRLKLLEFRNIQEGIYEANPHLNFLVGKNGQGKTSFLEAIGFLSSLHSFRGSKSGEVVRWGSENSEIACLLNFQEEGHQDWATELKINFNFERKHSESHPKVVKTAFINGKAYKSSTSYLSQRFGAFNLGFHSVIFNPSDHDLVRGEPTVRRSFIDRVLSAEDLDYLKTLQKYRRVLEQRNAILKLEEAGGNPHLLEFTAPLAEYAAELTYKRLQWLEKLRLPLDYMMRQIYPSGEALRLVYLSNWSPETEGLSSKNRGLAEVHFAGHGPLPSLEMLEQAFWKSLSDLRGAEFKVGHTLVGPHRDDWAFYLGSHPLRGHGSQGEVRSALVALKLAEVQLFQTATGHRPVFLLDDFSSELDHERRTFLLKFLMETGLQIFVTMTEDRALSGKKVFVINGKIKESEHDHRAPSEQSE
ncbi:MAG: DNA replication and repair protein RecF [Bdellovibrionota bacterium]